jgi:hypothetical protein
MSVQASAGGAVAFTSVAVAPPDGCFAGSEEPLGIDEPPFPEHPDPTAIRPIEQRARRQTMTRLGRAWKTEVTGTP